MPAIRNSVQSVSHLSRSARRRERDDFYQSFNLRNWSACRDNGSPDPSFLIDGSTDLAILGAFPYPAPSDVWARAIGPWASVEEDDFGDLLLNDFILITLGAEGVIPGRYIESFLRVFKQFTHTLPSG
jgi:hypothetical protein